MAAISSALMTSCSCSVSAIVQRLTVLLKQLECVPLRPLDDVARLLVDEPGRFRADVLPSPPICPRYPVLAGLA